MERLSRCGDPEREKPKEEEILRYTGMWLFKHQFLQYFRFAGLRQRSTGENKPKIATVFGANTKVVVYLQITRRAQKFLYWPRAPSYKSAVT